MTTCFVSEIDLLFFSGTVKHVIRKIGQKYIVKLNSSSIHEAGIAFMLSTCSGVTMITLQVWLSFVVKLHTDSPSSKSNQGPCCYEAATLLAELHVRSDSNDNILVSVEFI